MSKKLVSDLLVDYLERRGVTKLFGLCGHTVIGMLDALSRSKKIEYIGTRHEAIASTAADGYARITHKASVVMCHLGPGLTNVITGVANASLDSIPMVVIVGDVPSYYFGRHPHQEVQMHEDGDQYSMLKPVCKRSWRVDDVEALPYILDKAFRLAEAGRPGPVLVDVPMDMFSREMDEELWARTYKDSHETLKPALDPAAAKAIAKKLVEAKNPVLHAGGGILLAQASEELAALAEFLDLPVSRTLAGQGCLSDQHPLMIGQTGFWGLEFTHSLTANADVILGLGTRFGEADSSSWYQGVTFDPDKTTFLQIDIDPNEIGRNYPVEIGAIGDLKIGLAQILEEVKKICPKGKSNPELRAQIAKAKAANVPNDNIDRIIKKAAGEGNNDNFENVTYEGYGPSGVAVIVEALTDNRNRTAADVRHAFDKFGGNLGTTGCVSFMFNKKGVIVIEREGLDEDTVMTDALEAGASDFAADEDVFEISTEPADFSGVREDLEKKGYAFVSAEVEMVPDTYTTITDEDTIVKMQKMLDLLEDNDDVQNVWHNWDAPEEEEEE